METPRDKPKRKGPLDAVPTSPEEWANYDVPDEVNWLIHFSFVLSEIHQEKCATMPVGKWRG